MMPKIFYSFLIFFFYKILIGQTVEIRHPLDIPLYLSGTFGELRSNHFHSGIDIKTQGKEGFPVFAVDDGYVYRIKISHKGYGKALYVKHPSTGLISVYAHLKHFNEKIEHYIKQKQYKKQSFEIEVFPYRIELPVKKGDILAYSGNTGGSSGPHLHFEIRNMLEHPLNPFVYGIKIEDHTRPRLKNIFAYPLNADAQINQSEKRIKLNLKKINDSMFIADTIFASGKIGFGVEAYDTQDNNYNKNGLYRVKVKLNGLTVYEHIMQEFSFAKSHYINTFIDYPYYYKYRKYIQKLWVEPYNLLEIYTQLVNEGILEIKNGKNYQAVIELSDFHSNIVKIIIPIIGKEALPVVKKTSFDTSYKVKAGKETVFKKDDWTLIFRKNSAYFNFNIDLTTDNKYIKITIDNGIPIRQSFLIKYPLKNIKKELRKYVYLARWVSKKKKYYTYSVKKNDTLIGYTKRFGTYVLAYDSLPPVVKPVNFKSNANLKDYQYLKFIIYDRQTGIKSYKAFIDNQWILMEYEPKKNLLVYNFSDFEKINTNKKKHHLKLVVTDRLGNEKIYQTFFYR